MFALEYLQFQGTEHCPQYRWKQFAVCGKRELLERIRSRQTHPENWRVTRLACESISPDGLKRIACKN